RVLADAAAAVFHLVLVAIDGELVRVLPVAGRQGPPGASDRPLAGKLPSAHDAVHDGTGVAVDRLALSKGQIDDPVPAQAMLWNIGIPAIVEEPGPFMRVGGHGAGHVDLGRI